LLISDLETAQVSNSYLRMDTAPRKRRVSRQGLESDSACFQRAKIIRLGEETPVSTFRFPV
jgi:hypothetical protein